MHMNIDLYVCVYQLPIIFSMADKKTNFDEVFEKNNVEFCHVQL